ncbi:MAG TPA: hypothetical protein VGH29_17790, partial [Candidatus Binataceae bacterium]
MAATLPRISRPVRLAISPSTWDSDACSALTPSRPCFHSTLKRAGADSDLAGGLAQAEDTIETARRITAPINNLFSQSIGASSIDPV